MSISKAQNWLQNHSDTIPAISYTHQKIIELLEHQHKSQDIISCAAADPGLSLAILKMVNAKRGGTTGRDIVASTKSGIALLGDQVTHLLLKQFTVAESTLPKPHQLFLFRQIMSRSYHNEVQVAEWAEENGYKHIQQLKTCALLTYAGEALCCIYDFDHYLKYVNSGSVEGEEVNEFGFIFSQLTEALCQQLNLPEVIIDSQPHKNSHGQKEKFLFFIAKLCHQSEHGWYTQKQQQTFEKFAELLQQPVDTVIAKFHQISVKEARKSIIPEAWQAASRLMLTQDKAWTAPAPSIKMVKPKTPANIAEVKKQTAVKKAPPKTTIKSTETTKVAAAAPVKTPQKIATENDVFNRMTTLVKQQSTTQSDIINCCLNGLSKDFSFNRVSLLLLSKDKQQLLNRISVGMEKEAPFSQFKIDMSKAGLFKILLKKPQAIWISTGNFKKYEHIIPQSLLATIMTNDFLAMSLFIDDRAIGIIYADHSESTAAIVEKEFNQYKRLISLTSKALTFLSKK